MTSRRAFILNTTLAAVAIVFAVGLFELGIRWFGPHSSRHFILPPNLEKTLRPREEFVSGVSEVARYVTSSLGIRGTEFSPDGNEYNILSIGGSTTQNVFLDQEETWTLLLGKILGPTSSGYPTWTGDVGRSGHTARSHVLQFEYLVPELPEIDAIVILVGVNDLTVALRQGMNYAAPLPLSDPEARGIQIQAAFLQVPGRYHERTTMYQREGELAVKRTALYQLGSQIKAAWIAFRGNVQQDEFGANYAEWRAHRQEAPRIIDRTPDLTRAIEIYESYLVTIADFSAEYDVRLILVTQPTLWRTDLKSIEESALWLGGIGDFQKESGHDYFSSRVLAEVMQSYNAVLLDVCSYRDLECIDLASMVPKDLRFFYDDVHFTEAGSRLVAEKIAEYFQNNAPYASETL